MLPHKILFYYPCTLHKDIIHILPAVEGGILDYHMQEEYQTKLRVIFFSESGDLVYHTPEIYEIGW